MLILQLLSRLPWRTIALIVHAVLYIALSLAMLVAVDGYLAQDDGHTSEPSSQRPTFRSSDIITFVSAATMAVSWIAGIWSGSVLAKSGYVVWVNSREDVDKELVADKIRRTMDHQLPVYLGTRRDFTLVQIATLLVIPAFIAAPLLQGALDWRSSSEATGLTTLKSGNPAASFWGWNYLDGNARDADEENWGAASLAGITWDSHSQSSSSGKQTCRHVISHTQFPPGSKLLNAMIPCIIIHSISIPTTPVPPEGITIIDNPRLITTSKAWRLFGEIAGTIALFDPTNTSLPIPPVLGSDIPPGDIIFASDPIYPSPFLWSGPMTALLVIAKYMPYPPYSAEPFGIKPPPNSLPRGAVMSFAEGEGVRPEKYFIHLRVNFTAGVIHPPSSTYIKRNVIEADANDPEGGDIRPASWVKEAVYMMSDTMNCMVRMNSTAIPTWRNLESYVRDLVRFSYMAAWTNLQQKFEPNSTDLVVEMQEPRLQARVSRWRVVVWMLINVAFSSSWFLVWELRRRNGEIGEVDGFADFVLRMYAYFEKERERELQMDDRGHMKEMVVVENKALG